MGSLLDTPLGYLLGGRKHDLTRTLGLAVAALLVWLGFFSELDGTARACGTAICLVAVLPALLWCRGRAPGLPVFPVFALTHVWAFGLPVITGHPAVLAYPSHQLITAAATVCGYLLLATGAWLWVNRHPAGPAPMRVLDPAASAFVVWVPVAGAVGLGLVDLAGRTEWFGSFFSIVRASVTGLNTLAVFVLCLQWGNGQLPARRRPLLVLALVLQVAVAAAGLMLIEAMTLFLIALVAFTAGRGRVPVVVLLLGVVVFTFLHLGKATMRERHWRPDRDLTLQPADLPAWYAEWSLASIAASGGDLLGNLAGRPDERTVPLWWRSSTMQLLLLAQDRTPREVPFLDGDTYAIIPDLLVPRILNPGKLRAHEGTYRLNLHYGLQSYEDTWTTTIGWGLLNESFANFGYAGVAGLALLLGAGYGWITRFSAGGTLLSLRALAAILVLRYAFQTEFSAGVLLSALFQSTVALVILSWIIMRKDWIVPVIARRLSSRDD